MAKNSKVSYKKVISYAGAFIAFLIGSGFATGQEIMQYFTAYGYWGIASAVVMFILYLYVGNSLITAGFEQKFKKPSDVFYYYCGKKLGTFFDYFSIFFIYLSFFVMIAGAGANLEQQFGLPTYVGGIALGALAIGTVIFGLNKIVDIIGMIGPFIVILSVGLGIAAILKNPEGLAKANEILPQMNLLKASSNWFFSAGSYVGFCLLWLAAFLSQMGKGAQSKKEGRLGASIGAAAFSVAVIVLTLGLLANLELVAGSQIPNLMIAQSISPVLALVFSVIVLLGIYTTAVPLLWTAVARFAEEKTVKFKIMTVALGIVGIIIGLMIPFDRLVNVVYVINGYVGIILLAIMIVKDIRVKNERKNSIQTNPEVSIN